MCARDTVVKARAEALDACTGRDLDAFSDTHTFNMHIIEPV